MTKKANTNRTTQGLRDILFDEIAHLRGEDGNPRRAQAVAKLASQIINTAEVEIKFCRAMNEMSKEGQPVLLGGMQLGSQ